MNDNKSAIERVMFDGSLKSHYDMLHPTMVKDMLKDHPLDFEKDEPVPNWAVKLLCDKRVGYRTRVRIVLTHHHDITGDPIPKARSVKARDKDTAPTVMGKRIAEHRAIAAKRAADFIAKKDNEKKG